MQKIDILISGVGGQGTILAGNILARVAIKDNLDVKTAETHGMAQRGGSVITHARIGSKVYAPLIPRGDVDYLLSFEKLEALRNLPFVTKESTVILNTQSIAPLPVLIGEKEYPTEIISEIKSKVEHTYAVDAMSYEPVSSFPRVLNIFLIGILAYFLPFSFETWQLVLNETIPEKFLQINLNSFNAGYKWISTD